MEHPTDKAQVVEIVRRFPTAFYSLNQVEREAFIRAFPTDEILEILKTGATLGPLSFLDVFDETNHVSVGDGKRYTEKLTSLDERVIQDAIRDSIREKNASNPVEREHDSSIEVADHEHFSLKVKGVNMSFVGVVKGYKSVRSATIRWQDVAHQVVKAFNRTGPNHVLLVLAKNPADTVISESVAYGKTVGNPGLVVICDPVNLSRFLKARNII